MTAKDWKPPERLGSWQVLVTGGGTRAFYAAEHTYLRTRAAIWFAPLGSGSHRDLLKPLWRVQSANVARMYDCGVVGNYEWWATEWVEGESIAERLRERGPLPEREAVSILAQVLRGLESLHRAGIVHRDLRPENILLRQGDGSVVIADFGTAVSGTDLEQQSRGSLPLSSLEGSSPTEDIRHVGVLACFMFTGGSAPGPWTQYEGAALVKTIRNESLRGFVGLCLVDEPGRQFADAGQALHALRAAAAAAESPLIWIGSGDAETLPLPWEARLREAGRAVERRGASAEVPRSPRWGTADARSWLHEWASEKAEYNWAAAAVAGGAMFGIYLGWAGAVLGAVIALLAVSHRLRSGPVAVEGDGA